MRSIAVHLLLSAACVVVGTSVVSAASGGQRLRANVPFAFRVGHTMALAGHYEIEPDFLWGVATLHNVDTRGWVSIVRQGGIYDPKDNRPRLVFRCSSGGCALSQIFAGADGWQVPAPKLSPAEKERRAVIYLDGARKSD